MNAWEFILENRIILIPALIVLGWAVKEIKAIPDKFIPLILLFLGIIFSAWIEMAFTLQAVIQGILVAGTAVMGNQIPKQLMKDE